MNGTNRFLDNGEVTVSNYGSAAGPESSPIAIVTRSKRWFLLSLFCFLAFVQSSVFVAWMPIANSVLKAYSLTWSSSTLAWQVNLATIANPFIQWPVWKAIHKFGDTIGNLRYLLIDKEPDLGRSLRWGSAFPLLIATGLQCSPSVMTVSDEAFKWLTFVSFGLVGCVGVVFFSSITKFSSIWFPPSQRTTATGLSCTCANLGALLPAVAGPLIVSDPNTVFVDPSRIKSEIQHYLLIYFFLSAILFATFLVFFPSESSLELEAEPSENISIKQSLSKLIGAPSVLVVLLVYGLNCLTHVWGSTLLTLTLAPLRVSQSSVGMMTIASILATAVLTLIVSRLADVWFRHELKSLLMVLLPVHSFSMIAFVVFVLTANHNVNNELTVSILFVICLSTLNSSTPLLFELGCELGHPVSEEIVAGSFDQLVNLFSIGFHFLFTWISSRGSSNDFSVILYLLMSIPCVTLVLFSFLKEDYKRSNAESENVEQSLTD